MNLKDVLCLYISFGISIISLIIAIIFLYRHNQYRLIIKYVAASLDLIDVMQKIPLRGYLTKLSKINHYLNLANENGFMEKELEYLRIKYQALYDSRQHLKSGATELLKFINTFSASKPNKKNFLKISKIYSELKDTYILAQELYHCVEGLFVRESWEREAILPLWSIYQKIGKELSSIIINYRVEIKKDAAIKITESFNKRFEAFYRYLGDGKYELSHEYIMKITDSLRVAISLIDLIPYAIRKINNDFVVELKSLEEKYNTTILSNNDFTFKKYLNSIIEDIKSLASDNLKFLKLRTSYSLLEKVEFKIKALNEFVKEEEKIKNALSENIEELKKIYEKLSSQTSLLVNKANTEDVATKDLTNTNIILSKIRNMLNQCNDIEALIPTVEYRTTNRNETKDNFLEKRNRVLSHIDTLRNVFDYLIDVGRVSSTNINRANYLLHTISNVQLNLSNTEILIKKNKHVAELDEYKQIIEKIKNDIKHQIDFKKIENIKDNDQYDFYYKNVTDLQTRVFVVNDSVKNILYLDMMAQYLIAYIERYSDQIDIKMFRDINNLYTTRKVKQSINSAIKLIDMQKK